MSDEILSVKNMNVYCPSALGGRVLKLLDSISFSIYQSDILGLVGETGAGKSILINGVGGNPKPPLWAQAESLIFRFDHQSVNLLQKDEDELRGVWGKKIAFIPPNARDRLNPILTVGRQVSNVVMDNLQASHEEARQRTIDMFKMVRLPDALRNFDNYPHELSGGMAQRVLIAIALSASPKLLLADEPTMGLDVTIQAQVLDLMADLLENLKSSVILATRDLGIVANYCNKIAVMAEGQLVEFSEVGEFFKNPAHPYSRYLLAAAFASHGWTMNLESEISKTKLSEETREKSACRLSNRCYLAEEVCRSVPCYDTFVTPTHYVKCHRLK